MTAAEGQYLEQTGTRKSARASEALNRFFLRKIQGTQVKHKNCMLT